ncbi:hypothetical protein Tco_1568159 [Tanacetum coccineum]
MWGFTVNLACARSEYLSPVGIHHKDQADFENSTRGFPLRSDLGDEYFSDTSKSYYEKTYVLQRSPTRVLSEYDSFDLRILLLCYRNATTLRVHANS